jgi:sulfatase maturation enzyme AslB (radical SAM superfamily)
MLRGEEDNYVNDYMVYDSEKKELVSRFKFHGDVEDNARFHKVDLIWYKTKRDAEDSAAARAVDCLLLRYPTLRYIMNRGETLHKYIPMNLQMESCNDQCRYCEEEAYDVESTPVLWKTISNSVDWVLQFDQSNGDIKFYFVTWAKVPDSSEVTNEFLKRVLDDEDNTFLQEYKGSRGSITNNLKSAV